MDIGALCTTKLNNHKVGLYASPTDIRFFATLFIGKDELWHSWVTAACGKTAAIKFRAEIRLSSSNTPECSNVYYRFVQRQFLGYMKQRR